MRLREAWSHSARQDRTCVITSARDQNRIRKLSRAARKKSRTEPSHQRRWLNSSRDESARGRGVCCRGDRGLGHEHPAAVPALHRRLVSGLWRQQQRTSRNSSAPAASQAPAAPRPRPPTSALVASGMSMAASGEHPPPSVEELRMGRPSVELEPVQPGHRSVDCHPAGGLGRDTLLDPRVPPPGGTSPRPGPSRARSSGS